MLGGCCVCLDERGWAENPLVYCDGQSCNVAVHQACYGIVKVPSGPWFCRKCESQERAAKVRCELCPHRDGALKRTDGGGWAHVVCALYVPEVAFGSVSSMEPIMLQKVPPDRFNKTCYICEEENRSSKAATGACMTCAKPGCKGTFHVTCAQMAGLLCEEASGGNQTKYCGYCKSHLAKIKKTSSFKSLSCTKVYKLPTTSSSDELTSPERTQCSLAIEPSMKPGHIRYTKAGKKRSKSLEDSLGISSSESEAPHSVAMSTVPATSSESNQGQAGAPQMPLSSCLQSSSVPIVSVEPLSIKPGTKSVLSPSKTQSGSTEKNIERSAANEEMKTVTESSRAADSAKQPAAESKGRTLTLPSLAEAAETVSAPSEKSEEAKTVPEAESTTDTPKEIKVDKDHSPKKVNSDKKKIRQRNKKDYPNSKRKESSKKSGKDKTSKRQYAPHKPVPPSRTSVSLPDDGIATFPRHSVVSLANMGAERLETYEAHEIGDNNKIIKPDFSIDGVAALEAMLEEQKQDTMEFFNSYGTTPEVAALIQALHSVRKENSQLQYANSQMSRRRDQLSLIKTRLSGLQTSNVTIANSDSNRPSSTQAVHPQNMSVFGGVISSPPLQPTQQQQAMNYPGLPGYTSVTTK